MIYLNSVNTQYSQFSVQEDIRSIIAKLPGFIILTYTMTATLFGISKNSINHVIAGSEGTEIHINRAKEDKPYICSESVADVYAKLSA
jgi:hypothetical protein